MIIICLESLWVNTCYPILHQGLCDQVWTTMSYSNESDPTAKSKQKWFQSSNSSLTECYVGTHSKPMATSPFPLLFLPSPSSLRALLPLLKQHFPGNLSLFSSLYSLFLLLLGLLLSWGKLNISTIDPFWILPFPALCPNSASQKAAKGWGRSDV